MKIGNTTTVAISISLIMLSSCALKEENKTEEIKIKKVTYSPQYNTPDSIKQTKIVACVGDQCRASIFADEKKSDIEPPAKTVKIDFEDSNTFTYAEHKRDIKIEKIDSKIAIQVGAFRKYRGAKIYAKRYSLLSSEYKTVIKKNIKDSKPIYKVRILGFKDIQEAKDFMYRYNLDDAFLVRR